MAWNDAIAASSGTKQRTLEQRIAWAYWESAQMDIQWKYPHGHPLPADPPAEFRIDAYSRSGCGS